jgi:hypothetical protein
MGIERTQVMVDKETRQLLKEIAVKRREEMWQTISRMAIEETRRMADKPRKAATK